MQTEDYLQLSRDVVKALAETEKTQVVQLNKGQCKLLKEKLLQTMRRIGEDLDSLDCTELAIFTQRCKGALQQLYRTVKDTEAIIHSCCRPKAAIKLTNINEACAQVLFKLDWCTAICLDGRLAVTASKSQQCVTKNIEGFGADECKIKMEEIRSVLLGHLDRSETTLEPELSSNIQPVVNESLPSLTKLEMSAPLNDEQRTKRLDLLSIEPKELRRIRCVGSGTFGTVHEVCWQGESFARKDFQSKGSFEQEAEILARLSHPNIVQVFGHCIAGKSSLVMELMNGNLTDHIEHHAEVLNEPSLELAVALDIMVQIAEGMKYLHEQKVAHRDLKCANILVNPVQILGMKNAGYAQVKLADFGLSKIKKASATYSMQTINTGTTRWMAPELYEESDPNECRYPFKADVYSYAITCFEILTAKVPFEDTTKNTEVRRKVKTGERPVLPVTLPTFLSSLIERCWDAEADKRPSFSEICAELRHFQGVLMISDLATKLTGKIIGQERVEVWDDLQC
jgi:serine/threonine protein kinase